MSITTTHLIRAAGVSAVVAGLLFCGVQINHPPIDLAFVSTTEFAIRQTMKVCFTLLSLIGITGMYLSQVKKAGVLGLIGYLILGAGFIGMLTLEVAALVILPAIVHTSPEYVSAAIGVALGGKAAFDIGLMSALNSFVGVTYMAGGLVFGIALFRAGVLARWASIMLAVATPLSILIPFVPFINQRLFAVPTGLALIALGSSLWLTFRSQGAVAETRSLPEPAVAR
ncbi:MAG TPA: hypothetical protein VFW55_07840 [Propionicimonas sp.]|nr:hypothetical protein [Propionicimonas sp.]